MNTKKAMKRMFGSALAIGVSVGALGFSSPSLADTVKPAAPAAQAAKPAAPAPSVKADAAMTAKPVQLSNDNAYKERQEILRRFPDTNNALVVGWFVGAADAFEFRDVLARYIPLANFLTNRTGELTAVMTDKLAESIADEALADNIDIVYTNVMEGARLVAKGWKPLVGRTEDLIGAVIMRTDIANPDSFEGKKIVGVDGGITTQYVKYSLSKSGVLPKVKFVEQNTSQNELIQVLRSKQVDGIIVRSGSADSFVKANPGYKVALKSLAAPGHLILVSPRASQSTVDVILKSMLELTPDVPGFKAILQGMDGFNAKDKKPFSDRRDLDLKVHGEVRAVLRELPKYTRFDERAEGGVAK